MNILLIEDDPILSTLLARHLRESLDVNVIVARTAEQAFIEMKRIPPPDFIIVDLGLPDSPSMKTVEAIPKLSKLNPMAPICVLSGTTDEKLIKLSTQLGADFFQPKQDMRSQVDLWNAIKSTYRNRMARGVSADTVGEELISKIDSLLNKAAEASKQ